MPAGKDHAARSRIEAMLEERSAIATGSTPVREAPSLRRELFVKDEGAIHPAYGGNKVRKLEFLLHGAPRRVATIGAAGSHHVLATAVHAAARGHEVAAVAFPRPWSPHAEAVLRAATARARIVACPDPGAAMAALGDLATDAAMLPAGGSSLRGTLGWVRAGLELGGQLRAGLLPPPRRIFLPLGTAGTVAGAAIGLHLAGAACRIVAVRVVPAEWLPRSRVAELLQEVAMELGIEPFEPAIEFDDFRLGGGYGVATEEARAAVARAAAIGIPLEPTYTGKTLAAALAAPDPGGPDLYWQTHSTVPLEPLLAEAPPLSRDLAAMLLGRPEPIAGPTPAATRSGRGRRSRSR